MTYRILGHTTSDDPSRYRDEREVEPWRRRDPIALFERRLRERGVLVPGEPEETAARARELVEAAIAAVEGAPPPPPESIIEDVYARPTKQLGEQLFEALRAWRGAARASGGGAEKGGTHG